MPRTQGRTPALTIEELARRGGLSTRNVRAYRTAGLLPPPTLDGRTGRYGDEHLRRVGVIGRLPRGGRGGSPGFHRAAPRYAGRAPPELVRLPARGGRRA